MYSLIACCAPSKRLLSASPCHDMKENDTGCEAVEGPSLLPPAQAMTPVNAPKTRHGRKNDLFLTILRPSFLADAGERTTRCYAPALGTTCASGGFVFDGAVSGIARPGNP